MGDNMFTVERIENDIVVLENRDNRNIINVSIIKLDKNVKVNDIVEYDFEKRIYKIKTVETNKVKKDIRDRFNRLKK